MSKSLGNVVAPQKVMNSLGADVLRLWVAATDYANEMSVSDEILKRMADSYRRMRNTLRFLLGNLHGFDPKRHALPAGQLLALDRWMLLRTHALQAEVLEAYRRYGFHLIYQKVHNFCSVELGGLYLDVIKDRMYTTPAAGSARRSAQTVMFHIAECMVRWLAPILSFTTEEVWRYLPGERRESVFHETWHTPPQPPADAIDWAALLKLRAGVTRALEGLRDTGATGAPPPARVGGHCRAARGPRAAARAERLAFCAARGGDHRRGSGRQGLDGAALHALRAGARAAGARYHPHLQHRRRLQRAVRRLGLAALAVRAARARCERGPHRVAAPAARGGARPARLRARAHHRRRARQPERPAAVGKGGRLHPRALGTGVLSGVQRGRFRHHGGRTRAADRCMA